MNKMQTIKQFVLESPKDGTYIRCPKLGSDSFANPIQVTRTYISKAVQEIGGSLCYKTKMKNNILVACFYYDAKLTEDDYTNREVNAEDFKKVIDEIKTKTFIKICLGVVSTDTLFDWCNGIFSFTKREMRAVLNELDRIEDK